MTAVIDASVLAKWFVDEEGAEASRRLRGRLLHAPDLIVAECLNVLWKKVRIGAFDLGYLSPAVTVMRHADLRLTGGLELADRAAEIAAALDHSVYDCFYLALAERRDLPLVSADDRLARKLAARAGTSPARVVAIGEFVARWEGKSP